MLEKSDLTMVAPGIFYAARPLVAVDRALVDVLKDAAHQAPTKRARLCLHPSPEAVQHDMLIVSNRETYVAPHRHFAKSETMLVIEGCATAVLFDDLGKVTKVMPMGPAGSGRLFLYRMPEMTYHGLLIESENLVFVESTKGPFRAADSENAPWAPHPDDVLGGARFATALRISCGLPANPGAGETVLKLQAPS